MMKVRIRLHSKRQMTRVMIKMTNLEVPGPGNVQGYWLKSLIPLHDKLGVFVGLSRFWGCP